MEKKIIKIVASVWTIAMVIIIGSRGYYNSIIKSPLRNINGNETREIKSGDTVTTIINRLSNEGKIKNPLLIKFYLKTHSRNIKVVQSEFEINSEMSINDILLAIDNAPPSEKSGIARVTIPEGKTVEEIAVILEEKGVIAKKDFIDSCKKYDLPPYIKRNAQRKYALEGFLFPDTYDFTKGSKGKSIIDTMVKNFENRLDEIRASSSTELEDKDIDTIVTLASIIEKEVQIGEERPLVSSVFENRLKIGMPLQSDPTVQYSLGVHKEKLSIEEYKINSPYNTYVVPGVPVGPISNPGKAAIQAALEPADTRFLYFCARNDGSHEFNETIEKHDAAVRKYQSN